MSRILRGDGPVTVAVATTGTTAAECLEQGRVARGAGADLVELRADLLDGAPDAARTAELAEHLSADCAPVPVLITVRSVAEGGGARLEGEAWAEHLTRVIDHLADRGAAASQGAADLRGVPAAVDVEIQRPGAAGLIDRAHRAGLEAVVSFHDMTATPADAQLHEVLARMARLGADLAKIAVMPAGPADVARLLAVTASAHETLEVPLATMAMGEVGMVSRFAAGVFGSRLVFATAGGRPSAPGQLPIEDLRRAMALLAVP
ncbi:MAG: type I 3-dehydroquinate dehydratase [Actinomyces sp.]|uniref:type I 3-dehydroquinate dehydratase n=1 Tax=Actinomyces sp. TaxID=29317 RepID=UPI0026DC44C2|nr:type I 3-dehydroquinate dehydratase [Actinomyces sp.]MDO4243210.1 type I 3-dehydroquinate dehydratase [Actinomyces sp.]